jgi:hypothetical protein
MSVHSVFDEMIEGHWESAVVGAPVVRVFDLNPSEDAMRGKTEHLKGRRLHHLNGACRKLAGDSILAAWTSVAAHLARSQ